LAKDAAGCEIEPLESGEDVPDCNEKIYGLRPSSLISTVMTVVNVFSACSMPLIGAVVDTTPYRRLLGRISAAIFCSVIFTGIFVSEETWFAIAILQIVMGFTAWFQSMVVYSYLPELTKDEVVLNEYTRKFATLAYVSMVLYLIVVTGSAGALGHLTDNDENKSSLDDEIATARIAQSVSFTVCCIGETLSWGFLFQKRPVLRIYESGQQQHSVWIEGFRQAGKTYVKIYKYYPRLKWFYLAVCFCDSALGAFTLLSITYLTEQLDMDAKQNGMTILSMLIGAIPGSYVGGYANRRIGPVVSSMVSLVLLIIMTALIAILLKGPGQEIETYILAGGWGLGMGWKWTCDRMVLCLCLPNTEQNAELSGVYVFSRQILSWLPPLVFTVLNEKGVSLRIGIATLNIYLLAGLFAYSRLLASGPAVDTSGAATDDSTPDQAENELHASEPENDALVQAESLDERPIKVQPITSGEKCI
jgi:MFS-type transporter involved in bile tolerance (Atg22 family)